MKIGPQKEYEVTYQVTKKRIVRAENEGKLIELMKEMVNYGFVIDYKILEIHELQG